MCPYLLNPLHWADGGGGSYLSEVEFLIWVRQAREFSRATVQVDIARPKSWEKTNL